MSLNDDLLKQGPREAPEPETAEQLSKRFGLKTAGGGVAAGGFGLAKLGLLGKFFVWFAAWRLFRASWYYGGWIAVAVVAAAVVAFIAYRKRGRDGW